MTAFKTPRDTKELEDEQGIQSRRYRIIADVRHNNVDGADPADTPKAPSSSGAVKDEKPTDPNQPRLPEVKKLEKGREGRQQEHRQLVCVCESLRR
jgi:hypothetical protein